MTRTRTHCMKTSECTLSIVLRRVQRLNRTVIFRCSWVDCNIPRRICSRIFFSKQSSQHLHRRTPSIEDDPRLDPVVLEHVHPFDQMVDRPRASLPQGHLLSAAEGRRSARLFGPSLCHPKSFVWEVIKDLHDANYLQIRCNE